ncbi:hypothetical protein [Desulfosporosinus sp. OT]|uniref:hypothetical protein n=1 Tax=Desulfosporosinus sp. OT TaxID=913865 RepID=UPI000223A7C5|nr:hypothetical protein [Desulfosporosinus sp. OT]EGW37727.1 hypothetical protein DOT_4360 [Desulfosporosinus sp. OT]
MKKIKDRHILGIVSGLCGSVVKTVIDEVSLRNKISKRSYRETAAGVWVNSRREATSWKGNVLGGMMDAGLSMLGGIIKVNLLSKNGRDHYIAKGAFYGVTYGSIVGALMSGFSTNKVKPKDAASNLSYVLCNAAYGMVTTVVASHIGDDSIFDSQPINDSLKSTIQTTEQLLKSNSHNYFPKYNSENNLIDTHLN